MKTISLEYAKRLSEKVEACLTKAQEIKKILTPIRQELLNAIDSGNLDARERLSAEIEGLRKILFKTIEEYTAMIKELSESEIIHGEKQA